MLRVPSKSYNSLQLTTCNSRSPLRNHDDVLLYKSYWDTSIVVYYSCYEQLKHLHVTFPKL